MLLTILLILSSLPAVIMGCGMTTHNLIAHRAQYFMRNSTVEAIREIQDMIREHSMALQGGAPFPDYLYHCGPNHDHGEDAHWTPFQLAAARYIRTLPKPWDEATEQLVVFMMGVTSHYIADLTWHGLRDSWGKNTGVHPGYGFIEVLGEQDYGCDGDLCEVAHGAADAGGEFVSARDFDLGFERPTGWYIPTDDLIKIFNMINDTVEWKSIESCYIQFAAGSIGVKLAGTFLYERITKNSSFLQEDFLWHPLGGVDDMAVWSTWMWERFADWVLNGVPDFPPPSFKYLPSNIVRLAYKVGQLTTGRLADLLLESKPCARGVCIQAKPITCEKFVNAMSSVEQEQILRILGVTAGESLCSSPAGTPPEVYLDVATPKSKIVGGSTYGYLGHSLASGDINGDGHTDLIAGEFGFTGTKPQSGTVRVFLGTSNGQLTEGPSLFGSELAGRFGASVALYHLNKDTTELIVGSPNKGPESIPDLATFTKKGKVSTFGWNNASAEFKYVQEKNGFNLTFFGDKLTVTDSGLFIGSPLAIGAAGATAGRLDIFLRNRETSITLSGSTAFSWFGNSVASFLVGGSQYLAVGAPGYRAGKQSVGRLHIFNVTSPVEPPQEVMSLIGSITLPGFGYAVASCGGALVVGAPKASDKVGKVFLYNPEDILKLTGIQLAQSVPHKLLEGGKAATRFGRTLTCGGGGQVLAVAAPITPASVYAQPKGIVQFYRVSTIREETPEAELCSEVTSSENERFGDDVVFLGGGLQNFAVAVGAPMFNNGQGRILTYSLNCSSGRA